jgi:hypothetical protein
LSTLDQDHRGEHEQDEHLDDEEDGEHPRREPHLKPSEYRVHGQRPEQQGPDRDAHARPILDVRRREVGERAENGGGQDRICQGHDRGGTHSCGAPEAV